MPRALAIVPVLPHDPAPSRAPHQTRCSRRVTLAGHPPVGLRTHSLDGGVRGISARAPDAFRVSRRRPLPRGNSAQVQTFPSIYAVESKRRLAAWIVHIDVAPQRSVACRASAIMRIHAASAELRRLAGRRVRPIRASMMTHSGGWQPPRVLLDVAGCAPVQAPRAQRIGMSRGIPCCFYSPSRIGR